VTPDELQARDAEERARIARVFARGLTTPAGFVLPIQRWQAEAPARAGARRSGSCGAHKLFLVPGDSPVGYRLPLGSLPYVPPPPIPTSTRATPATSAPPLPDYHDDRAGIESPAAARSARRRAPSCRAPGAGRRARQERVEQSLVELEGSVRTALAVEPRDGRLCVFMPPVERWRTISTDRRRRGAAEKLGLPVHIEGYAAAARSAPERHPRRARSRRDRGEHPPRLQLGECVATTEPSTRRRADAARRRQVHDRRPPHRHRRRQPCRVGGADAAMDSPFLRRPDLLKSLSSTGSATRRSPTCSPACSSARPARRRASTRRATTASTSWRSRSRRSRTPGEGQAPPPWLVDRLFRNLLVDVTGNTHRTEICIDKLFSPDGPTGRLGLVEFRGFEMPPDPRMSLAQQLLMRALIAWFWRDPLDGPLVRWGTRCTTASCCRISSGRISWTCSPTSRARLRLRPEWFEAQFEFRFPFCGAGRATRGAAGTAAGARAVARAGRDRRHRRHRALCRQLHRAPAGGPAASGVAGVRYKAWQPPSACIRCCRPMRR
jgi:uncharacterized protein (DUF2126 family)